MQARKNPPMAGFLELQINLFVNRLRLGGRRGGLAHRRMAACRAFAFKVEGRALPVAVLAFFRHVGRRRRFGHRCSGDVFVQYVLHGFHGAGC